MSDNYLITNDLLRRFLKVYLLGFVVGGYFLINSVTGINTYSEIQKGKTLEKKIEKAREFKENFSTQKPFVKSFILGEYAVANHYLKKHGSEKEEKFQN